MQQLGGILQVLFCLVVTWLLGYGAGSDRVLKDIIEQHKIDSFYVVNEGEFRLECKAVELETVTRDKEKKQ